MFLNNLAIHTVLCLFSFESEMCDDYRRYEIYSKGYVEQWAGQQGIATKD